MGTVSIWIYTLSQLEEDNALLEKFNKKLRANYIAAHKFREAVGRYLTGHLPIILILKKGTSPRRTPKSRKFLRVSYRPLNDIPADPDSWGCCLTALTRKVIGALKTPVPLRVLR